MDIKRAELTTKFQRELSIRYIQELRGHKHLSMTQIYTHISNYNLQKIKSPFDANEFQSLV